MSEYRLGVLGGMGPQATNTFFQYVLDRTEADCDQEHVNTLIFSDSRIPDRTGAILSGDTQPVYDRLIADVKLMEQAGCTVLAVPCNTCHYFLDEVQKHTSVPILHMIRETAQYLVEHGYTRPGILATDGTIRTGLYQKEFEAFGITAVSPTPEAQKLVMSLIYDDIKAGKPGDSEKFQAVYQDLLEQGCDCGILACTELSVFANEYPVPAFFTDALVVLAERAIIACHKPLRKREK